MICSWIINNNTLLLKAIITIYFIVFECKSIFSSFYRYLCFIRSSLLFIPSSSTLRHPFREALPALPRLVVFFFFFTRYPGNPPSLPPYLPSSSSPPPPPPASASRHCWEAGRGVNGWIMRLFTVHVNVPNGILKVTAAGRDHSRFRSSSDSSRSGKCVQERSSRRDCTGENCSSVSSEQLSGPLLLPENTDEHEHTVRCISAALLMDLIAAVQPWLMIMSYLYPFMKMILNQFRCGGV